jgi:hypothetical protein
MMSWIMLSFRSLPPLTLNPDVIDNALIQVSPCPSTSTSTSYTRNLMMHVLAASLRVLMRCSMFCLSLFLSPALSFSLSLSLSRSLFLSLSLSLSLHLCMQQQVRGRKRVVLYPPQDADFMYMQGDKSAVLDIDSPDYARFPLFAKARAYECYMQVGDVLFLPSLWFQCVCVCVCVCVYNIISNVYIYIYICIYI